MSNTVSSCQYIFNDVQKPDLALIHGRDLSISFGEKERTIAVNSVDFNINEGEITAIIGESGSGKSTLLKLIYGLIEPETGEVRFRGWLVPTRKDKLIPGHDSMKLVSQGFDDLNHYAKVWDNIASQMSNKDLSLKKSKTEKVLKKLNILHLAQHRVADLSGGEKQRVAIARALINEPDVLLMDEPFNQVDAAFRDSLQQDIKNIVKDTGLTVLLVSHDPAEVLAMADNLLVMKNGNIVDFGQPKDLYYSPKSPYTALLLAKSNILSPSESQALDIQTEQMIAIHQEWIDITEGSNFEILDIRFRGFYKEYVILGSNVTLHSLVKTEPPLPIGSKVNLLIKQHITFEALESFPTN